jgi:hypothetical protein
MGFWADHQSSILGSGRPPGPPRPQKSTISGRPKKPRIKNPSVQCAAEEPPRRPQTWFRLYPDPGNTQDPGIPETLARELGILANPGHGYIIDFWGRNDPSVHEAAGKGGGLTHLLRWLVDLGGAVWTPKIKDSRVRGGGLLYRCPGPVFARLSRG